MFVPRNYVLSTQSVPVVGSIREREHRHEAVGLVKDGFPVGIYVRGVAVVIVDAAHPRATDVIYRAKGERRTGKPMATLLPTETLVRLVDPERIPGELHHIFLDPQELESRLGALSSIRIPLRRDAVAYLPSGIAPKSDDGIYWLQSWVPDRTSPGGALVQELQEQQVMWPGVTSMNASGDPEIVDQGEALSFSAARGVPLFLGDPQAGSRVRGSFPILQVGPDGIHVIREGHFSARMFRRLLDGAAVDASLAKGPKYPLVETDSLDAITSPYRLHDRLIMLLDGTEVT